MMHVGNIDHFPRPHHIHLLTVGCLSFLTLWSPLWNDIRATAVSIIIWGPPFTERFSWIPFAYLRWTILYWLAWRKMPWDQIFDPWLQRAMAFFLFVLLENCSPATGRLISLAVSHDHSCGAICIWKVNFHCRNINGLESITWLLLKHQCLGTGTVWSWPIPVGFMGQQCSYHMVAQEPHYRVPFIASGHFLHGSASERWAVASSPSWSHRHQNQLAWSQSSLPCLYWKALAGNLELYSNPRVGESHVCNGTPQPLFSIAALAVALDILLLRVTGSSGAGHYGELPKKGKKLTKLSFPFCI